ncbi:uncharacterized protein LOC126840548 [Adelges cooleyi]|uniref:uncharacterized protein LOC126840548 n=1 Tax=Adelges cooleyi TaxID=133065 RepID=UPI0021809A7F|nr:uncharacterized protein LOC126840548 [Adelges cooleyi]
MYLFNVSTFPLLLIACFRVTAIGEEDSPAKENDTTASGGSRLVYSYDWVQSLDRGYFSKPIKVDQRKSHSSVAELVRKSYKELTCSYAFSVLLHMYLTRVFIVNPSQLLRLTKFEVDGVLFKDEAAAILTIVHNHYDDDVGKKDMMELMWMFQLYAEKTAAFVWLHVIKGKTVGGDSLLSTCEILVEFFEVFLETNSCVAYDPKTHHPTDVRQYSNIEIAMAQGETSSRLAAVDNKIRFKDQTAHNLKLGLNLEGSNRFFGIGTLVTELLGNGVILNTLKVAFGSQLNWNLIVGEIKLNYLLGQDVEVHLHVRIKALVAVLKDFIDLLKAIVIRTVIGYMLYVKDIINQQSYLSIGVFMLRNCSHYNAKMAEHLTEFARRFHLTDDRYLRPVIESMTKPTRNFYSNSHIDGCINDMFESLRRMSSGVKQFGKPMEVNEDRKSLTINEVIKMAKAHGLNYSSDEDNRYAIRESLLSAEVFVGFVKTITNKTDFKVIKSFVQLEASESYKRLKELENIELNDLDQLVNLKF